MNIKALKAQAHNLKPVVIVGKNGMTESVISEIDLALQAHELIKIKFQGDSSKLVIESQNLWLSKLGAELVNSQGHILTIYRKNPEEESKKD